MSRPPKPQPRAGARPQPRPASPSTPRSGARAGSGSNTEPHPTPITLTVERAALGGKLLGHAPDGRVAWVEGVVGIGDRVEGRVTRAQKRSVEVRVGRVVEEGPGRATPFCDRVNKCGGCPWQALTEAQQLSSLERDVGRELERVMGEPLPWAPSFSSPERAWRHTARLHLRAPTPALGFFGAEGEVVDLPHCPTFAPALNAALRAARQALIGSSGALIEEGALHANGELRLSAALGASSATLSLTLNAPLTRPQRATLSEAFERLCAEVGGPVHGVALSAPRAQSADAGFETREWGRPFNDLPVPHHAAAFMQAHQEGNAALIDEVVRGCAGEARLLELYAGSGNLSAPLARSEREGGRHLTCLELDPRAVSALRALAAAEALPLSAETQRISALPAGVWRGDFDHIVLDPPRDGAAPIMEALATAPVRAISYISCHPAALARDLAPLKAKGWRVTRARIFHLFPHSGHAEVYVQLTSPHAGAHPAP
jgi:23S rRNA (uracil1939-C5)-methyltransferase